MAMLTHIADRRLAIIVDEGLDRGRGALPRKRRTIGACHPVPSAFARSHPHTQSPDSPAPYACFMPPLRQQSALADAVENELYRQGREQHAEDPADDMQSGDAQNFLYVRCAQ